jgi:hypothetical protein
VQREQATGGFSDARVLVAADLLQHPFQINLGQDQEDGGAVVRLREASRFLKPLRDRDLARGRYLLGGKEAPTGTRHKCT